MSEDGSSNPATRPPPVIGDDGFAPPRRRTSPLRLLAMVVLSIIVSMAFFRLVVEAMRWAMQL